MRIRVATLFVFLLGVAFAAEPPVAVKSIHAYLLNGKTGQLSGDVLGENPASLTNAIIGEFQSRSTLVTVRLQVMQRAAVRDARVRLVATEGPNPFLSSVNPKKSSKVILDQTTAVGSVSEDGLTHVAFWLADTGCKPIALRVTVNGGPPTLGRLDFVCHE
jgi:hypothetical protein